MHRTLLIDGDIVVYQYSSTVEHEIDWGDDVWSLWADAKEAQQLILQYLDILVEETAADDFIFCFSDKDNFRKDIDSTYKSNRKGKRKPVCYKALKEWIQDQYKTETWNRLEADDVMGIMATADMLAGEKVIVSEDKDMKTIPGLLWRSGEMLNISQEQADYNHLYQTLVGDATDGYPGLRGVGDKRATELLKTPTWETVIKAFEKAGQTEEDALVQARLARILRASDYNFEFDQPIIWSPA
jgi:DNA polymerase-1